MKPVLAMLIVCSLSFFAHSENLPKKSTTPRTRCSVIQNVMDKYNQETPRRRQSDKERKYLYARLFEYSLKQQKVYTGKDFDKDLIDVIMAVQGLFWAVEKYYENEFTYAKCILPPVPVENIRVEAAKIRELCPSIVIPAHITELIEWWN